MTDLVATTNAQLNTVEETLKRLRICRRTGYNLINSGQLRSVKLGRRRLIPEQAIVDFIADLEAASACASEPGGA